MTLTPGTRLGPYEVVAPLGAGGMGEVYRARDVQLRREVAVKVLPHEFAADSDRLARFEREARVLAALNHPHIAAIYGFETTGDTKAIVLELVEGPTLAERLRSGPLPAAETLALARQIADAIDAAHEKGIVHRDLKPANIKLTPDGTVKVLDFGLAQAPDAVDSGMTNAPTVTSAGTVAGAILGTAPYMSPEQARGQPVDRRTDIWAFGCVLYEMLTGRQAFGGATVSDVIAGILERNVDWTRLPAHTPQAVNRLLRRALEKDPKKRLRDIGDARIELDEAMTPEPADSGTRRPRHTPVGLAISIASALALGVLGFALGTLRNRDQSAPAEVRVHQLTELSGLEEAPALSPDGKAVAFTAGVGNTRQIFVKLLAGGGPPLKLSRDAAVDHLYPRWSRDASTIVYFSPSAAGAIQGTLWQVPALGGAPRRLGSSIGGGDINSADGRLAFFRLADKSIHLVTTAADGGNAKIVAAFEPLMYYLYPRWSPDGKWIAFQRGEPPLRFDVFMVPSDGGTQQQVTHENGVINGFSWLPDSSGILYSSTRGNTIPYLANSGLWQVALGERAPRQVTSSETSYASPDVAADGRIAVTRMRMQSDIWKFPVDGRGDDNVARATRLTRQTAQVLTPTASGTGNEVAFLSDSGGHANLWVINDHGELRQITHERDPAVAVGAPLWAPDGRTIAFVSSRGNPGLTFGVWLVDPDGSNLRQLANPGLGPAWSHDGRWVYYSTRGSMAAGAELALRKIAADGGNPIVVRTEPLRNVIGSDGSTLYYVVERPLVDGSPAFEIRAASPETAPSRILTTIPASRVPIWQIVNPALSPDGKWLAQPLTDGFATNIWALSTATAEWRQITDFRERPTFIARRVSWSADGRSILAAVSEGDADIVVLEGLLATSRKR